MKMNNQSNQQKAEYSASFFDLRKARRYIFIILILASIVIIGLMLVAMYYTFDAGLQKGYNLCKEGKPLYKGKIEQVSCGGIGDDATRIQDLFKNAKLGENGALG